MVHSESEIDTEMEYKPGGTMTGIIDIWQACITKQGKDERGLGQWSYVILSSDKQKLAIITAYKPCKTTGPNTAWTAMALATRTTDQTGSNQRIEQRFKQFITQMEIRKYGNNVTYQHK
jgi:hypothetical protein